MKRRSGNSSAYVSSSDGEQGFWPSYADMMSAVALILFFVMLLSYIQNMITGQNLRGTEEELKETLAKLAATSAEVEQAQKELELLFDDLEIARKDLDTQQVHIDEQQAHIAEQEQTLAEQADYILKQQADISAQRDLIAQQQAQANQQQEYLDATQAELSTLRSQMQSVAVLRLEIVEQIRRNIEEVMGNANTVTVNENGNLVLSESVLFRSGSADLTSGEFKSILDQLADGFAAFLSDPSNTQYVDSIVIGGHADSTGSDYTNRKLSSDRANSVLNYLMETHGGELKPYAQFFCASGYSSSRPVASNEDWEGRAKNRRIEISIVLKDESILEILDEYLAIEVPKV